MPRATSQTRLTPPHAYVLSLQARAGNAATARLIGSTTDTPVVQRIRHDPGSWQPSGSWRDEETRARWHRIEETYEAARDKIRVLTPNASATERKRLADVAAELDAMDEAPIPLGKAEDTLISLLYQVDRLQQVQARIEERFREPTPEEAKKAKDLAEAIVAAAVLTVAIAWQTGRRATGAQRGRGHHTAEWILERMGGALVDISSAPEQRVVPRWRLAGRDAWGAFKIGLDPRPMPVAPTYAPFGEVVRTAVRAVFILTAGREKLEETATRTASFAAREGTRTLGPGSEVGVPKAVRDAAVGHGMRARSATAAGFGAGVYASGRLMGLLPVLRSPFLFVQSVWDGYHVLNDVTVRLQRMRQSEDAATRRIAAHTSRVLYTAGRRHLKDLFSLRTVLGLLTRRFK